MVTKELRNQIFEAGTPAQQYLYADGRSGEKLQRLARIHNLFTDADYKKFVLLIGDIVLGFYKIQDTVPLLQQELGIDPKSAALLGVEVLDFLTPLSDPQFIVPEDMPTTATMQPQPTVVHAIAQPTIEPHVSTPLPIAPEYRTMASDMARSPERTSYEPLGTTDEPLYSSQQPAVRTPLSSLPAYHINQTPTAPQPTVAPEPPRWSA